MNNRDYLAAGMVVVLGLLCGPAWGVQPGTQPPPAPPVPADPLNGPELPSPPAPRDPTVPQGELRMLLNPPSQTVPGAVGPAPYVPPPLPPITVRAKVIGNGKAAALLTLGGNAGNAGTYGAPAAGAYYQVTPGQSFHLQGGGDWNLSIISIKSAGVVLELDPGKRQLVLP